MSFSILELVVAYLLYIDMRVFQHRSLFVSLLITGMWKFLLIDLVTVLSEPTKSKCNTRAIIDACETESESRHD